MHPEVILTISDGAGKGSRIPVQSRRFTIGRNPDNDLSIQDSSLSRRHAVIENFSGVIQISDCGSQNGTRVNSDPVIGGVVLHDGDVITLSDTCELMIQIGSNGGVSPGPSAPVPAAFPTPAATPAPVLPPAAYQQPSESGPSWLSAPVIAAGSVVVILVFAGLLILILGIGSEDRPSRTTTNSNSQTLTNVEPFETPLETQIETEIGNTNVEVPGSASLEHVEKAATQVMRRISSDDKTYGFSEKSLRDIEQKVREYQTRPGFAASLASMQRASQSIATEARREGIEGGLVIYVALANTDGGQTGDPVANARAVMPELLRLRAIFGTNDSDSSLILIAASRVGKAERRSHPLLAVIRRLVKNPLTQRNVWFLHERGGINSEAYNFVLKVLALGVIAQDPRQFGVAADPLVF